MTVGKTRNAKTNPAGPLGIDQRTCRRRSRLPRWRSPGSTSTTSPACSRNRDPGRHSQYQQGKPPLQGQPPEHDAARDRLAVIRQERRDAQDRQHPEEPAESIGDVGQIDRFRHGDVPRPGADGKPVDPHRFDGPGDQPGALARAQAGPSSSSRLCRYLEPLWPRVAGFVVRLGGDTAGEGNEPQHGDSDSQKDRLAHPT